MKILALSDLHVGISRESTTHPGIVRQANSDALETLKKLIPKLRNENFDLLIQMGDVFRDLDHDTDLRNLKNTFGVLGDIGLPTINVLGNHDIEHLSLSENILSQKESGFSGLTHGVVVLGDLQIVWLDFERRDDQLILSADTIKNIEKNIDISKNTILFSHYSLASKNLGGNFLFANKPEASQYSNPGDLEKFLNKIHASTVISAHDHWGSFVNKNNINFVTLPSFSENFLTSTDTDKSPGVYSVLEINGDRLEINSYSGDYSFFHLEFQI